MATDASQHEHPRRPPFDWRAAWREQVRLRWYELVPGLPIAASVPAYLCGQTETASLLLVLALGMIAATVVRARAARHPGTKEDE